MAVALMTPRQLALYLGIALALIGTGVWIGASAGAKHYGAKAEAAQAQADQHEGAAQTHAAQAAESDQQATKQQATVNAADAQVAAAKRELDRRLAALHGDAPASNLSPASPRANGAGSGVVKDSLTAPLPSLPSASDELALTRAALAQAQAVTESQDEEIAALKLQVSLEHASAVQWKAAYDESQKALALEAIAKDAAVHEAKSSGLRAQLVRGLEGLAIGYAAGRLTR